MADQKYDLEKIEKKLKKYLDKGRMMHTQGVMYTAACMAMIHECDIIHAQVAGLLHDCAKCIPDYKTLKMCSKNKITLTDYELNHPFIIHAKLGAWIARKKYGIREKEILNAITWHTTGKPSMTDLEKIIYIADYIEPGRHKAKNLDAIRKMAFIDLDETMYMILADTLDYLKESKKEIDPATETAYVYYSNLHNQG